MKKVDEKDIVKLEPERCAHPSLTSFSSFFILCSTPVSRRSEGDHEWCLIPGPDVSQFRRWPFPRPQQRMVVMIHGKVSGVPASQHFRYVPAPSANPK